jgi:hypothetical protein
MTAVLQLLLRLFLVAFLAAPWLVAVVAIGAATSGCADANSGSRSVTQSYPDRPHNWSLIAYKGSKYWYPDYTTPKQAAWLKESIVYTHECYAQFRTRAQRGRVQPPALVHNLYPKRGYVKQSRPKHGDNSRDAFIWPNGTRVDLYWGDKQEIPGLFEAWAHWEYYSGNSQGGLYVVPGDIGHWDSGWTQINAERRQCVNALRAARP